MWSSLLLYASAGLGGAVSAPAFLTSLLATFMVLASLTFWSIEDED